MKNNKISAKILRHTKTPNGEELVSFLLVFPRIILPEVLNHRMFSRNTSSSRAIPLNKMIEVVENDCFIPLAFQKDHKGMQGTEYLSETNDIISEYYMARSVWIESMRTAVSKAKFLNGGDKTGFPSVTKQLCNRLLEPFMWTTMLMTTNKEGLYNFFNLRCPRYVIGEEVFKSKSEAIQNLSPYGLVVTDTFNKDINDMTDLDWLKLNISEAEIHIQDLAEKMYDNFRLSVPENLKEGQWHIPYEQEIREMYKDEKLDLLDIIKISVSISARTSYTSIEEGKILSVNRHLELYKKLITSDPPHSSPLEHIGCVMKKSKKERRSGNFIGYKQLRHIVENNKLKKYFKNENLR